MESMDKARKNKKNIRESFLKRADGYGSVLGLDSIVRLCDKLGHPERSFSTIHITGTNGKGSVGTYLSRILFLSGRMTGHFSSPAVFDDREVFRVNGQEIAEDTLTELYLTVKEACDALVREGFAHPTRFEIDTAVAFLFFKESHADIAVVEVGMGGETDATNVIPAPVACVFTPIGVEHTAFLGESLREIATVKSGIIKDGSKVFSAVQDPEVRKVLKARALSCNSPYFEVSPEDGRVINDWIGEGASPENSLVMSSTVQRENAALAYAVSRELGIDDRLIREGILSATLRGRMEKIADDPAVYIDGAHNPPAALALSKNLEARFTNASFIYIMGVLKDKNFPEILKIMSPYAAEILCVSTTGPRGLVAEDLAKEAQNYCDCVTCASDVKEAVRMAFLHAKDRNILCFGSFTFLKEVTEAVKDIKE